MNPKTGFTDSTFHMTLRLKPDKRPGKRTKQIVGREIKASLRDLEQGDLNREELDETVHAVRKRLKKVRAVLRLVRGELGSKTYHRENDSVRESAHPLRDLRDAQALIETLDKLTGQNNDQLSVRACADLRELLESRKQDLCRHFGTRDAAYKRVLRKLHQARVHSREWKLEGLDWSVLRHGLQDVYVAGSQAFELASANRTAENLHEWRKQVKCFWYQLQVLRPVWKKVRDDLGRELDVLSETLGEDHDLALLNQLVRTEADARGRDAELVDLTIVIDDRRTELERAALDLGRRVYSHRPKTLMKQIERWWKT
jgi:CHAD domain-containing protein